MTGTEAIALIGVGCRFPDAWTPEQYWANIAAGRVSIRDLDPDLLLAAGRDRATLDDEEFVARGAGIPNPGDFAAEFFGYSPAEAAATDPQQRVFLEVCWQALESAGHAPHDGRTVTGVFAGGSPSTYLAALQADRARTDGVLGAVDDVALHLGGLGDFLPSRVAYKLGLRGPSIGVQTACSSSLTAVHYAVQSLRSGECDLALAGGASVNEPMLGYRYHPGGLQSKDGYCRPFDARSTGTSFSSGVGVVALRRLSDALRDGDPVLAVVHGTAVGNDGSARSGFTAPSPSGLADVVAAALDAAEIRGEQLRYVEAHGSGTPLGDQIELRGLTSALRRAGHSSGATAPANYCGLGSVKANIGHAGPAAGIAGLIKAVGIARTGQLPPHPLFERPRNPGVLADSPFRIGTEPASVGAGDPAYVLVNSMGLGGTNATAVIGPPPEPVRPPAPSRATVRLLLSARSEDELATVATELADALSGPHAPALSDAAHTLRVGRTAHRHRRVVEVATDAAATDAADADADADTGSVAAAALRAPTAEPARRLPKVVLALPADHEPTELDALVLERLTAAFRGRAETAGPGQPLRLDRFTVLVGAGEPGEGRHVLPLDGLVDADGTCDQAELTLRVDAAAASAWLHGAEVDWQFLGGEAGRRVALPTYPFTRTTHWALDDLPPLAAPAVAPAGVALSATGGREDDPGEPGRPGERVADAGAGDGDPVEATVLALWRRVLGHPDLDLDGGFDAHGGDSLAALRIEAGTRKAFGVEVSLYRVGGADATARRMAQIVRALGTAAEPGGTANGTGPAAESAAEADPLDADLLLDLGALLPTAPRPAAGGALLTGATRFLDTFVLHELLKRTGGLVHCVVPADDEAEARQVLRARAAACALPEPDPRRVRPLCVGADGSRDWTTRLGQLPAGIARVFHTAAPFGLEGAYEDVREETVLPLARLLRWMRQTGVDDLALLSTLSACGSGLGGTLHIEETRQQPLRPGMPGGAVAAWVGERLAERAEQDGMRVRVFRTGLLLGAADTGACDPDHPLLRLVTGALAVGVHPRDERPLAVSPVDLAARAVAELALSPASEGRAYHLVAGRTRSAGQLFDLLAAAGRSTRTVSEREWQRAVALRALDRENEALDPLAVHGLARLVVGAPSVEAHAWRGWLDAAGLDPEPSAAALLSSLAFAAAQRSDYAELLGTPVETR
ncbi:phthiocerol/phenolphthiocerol synthesis type-I polyketide synthase E [Streptacidiphilus sp. BW17]|uniref:beta-ketoacyl synthase N-terminal-like domain-containing protein n=1 Tax=Streptacidiphilus sp. BW17 TaxID=3156274 RepID=UPI0035191E53